MGAVLTVINNLFFVLGGVVVFMVGMEMMGANLEKAAGKSMRNLMSKATRNKAAGIGTGAVVTAIVNSSSATTVMIVGFVNVGFMTLTQATSLIMGANIGTTISAFVMALSSSGTELEVSAIFALLAFVGLMINMLGKTDKVKRIGNILAGAGLIFVGLNVMSSAVGELTAENYYTIDGEYVENEVRGAIVSLFTSLGYGKDILTWEVVVLFLLGAALTALMQSSAAITAIVISLASNGLISIQMAMCIILGTNVGTCCTSLLSSIGASTNAKRAATIHLLFNVIGSLIFIFPVAFAGNYIAVALEAITEQVEWEIAIFHMFFNVTTTLLLVCFTKYIVKLACLIVREKKDEPKEDSAELLDSRLLKTPAIAVGQARKELVKMGRLAFSNYKRSIEILLSYDMSQREEFEATEQKINELNKYITSFLVKVSAQEISETDEKKVGTFYNVASDLERIGDYAENIVEYAEQMINVGGRFSEHAVAEIRETDMHLTELYNNVEKVFQERDLSYFDAVEREENETDRMKDVMQKAHLRRMNDGRCTAAVGAVYLQLAANLERIGDHMYNIARSVKVYTTESK